MTLKNNKELRELIPQAGMKSDTFSLRKYIDIVSIDQASIFYDTNTDEGILDSFTTFKKSSKLIVQLTKWNGKFVLISVLFVCVDIYPSVIFPLVKAGQLLKLIGSKGNQQQG